MDFSTIFAAMAKLFLILLVGFAGHRLKIFPEPTQAVLTRIVIYITTPCTILYSVLSNDSLPGPLEILRLLGVAVLCYGAVAVFALIAVRLMPIARSKRNIFLAMLLFSNCGFIGIPVVMTIFGSESVFVASIYNMPFQVMLYSLGIYLTQGGNGTKFQPKQLLNPCIVAGILSIILAIVGWRTPGVITGTIGTLNEMTTPASLLVIGISIAKQPFKKMFTDPRIYLLTALRLAALPALIWLVASLFLNDPVHIGVLAVLFGMPVASMVPMLTAEDGGDDTDPIRGVFLSTVLSLISIPLLVTIMM